MAINFTSVSCAEVAEAFKNVQEEMAKIEKQMAKTPNPKTPLKDRLSHISNM